MTKSSDPRLPALFLALHLGVTTFAWRDLNRRDASQLRGPKWFWRLATGLNSLGTIAYLVVGRRRTSH